MASSEGEYLRVLRDVLDRGERRPDRTGTGTLSLFGAQMRFDISATVPALTTKFVPWKSCVRELLWFCRGDTDARTLSAQGVKIWDANSSRAFLDARGLHDLEQGLIGPSYGWQFRHAGAAYGGDGSDGVDQLAEIERLLIEDPYSRRIFMSSWSANQIAQMAVPACHTTAQFYVSGAPGTDRTLSCHMYQRSGDMFLGVPWNVLSYSVLTHVLAARAGLRPKELIVSFGDAHVYADHVGQAREQLTRAPFEAPALVLSPAVRTKTWDELCVEDFELVEYRYHPAIRARMSV